jgi:hypothetical protein
MFLPIGDYLTIFFVGRPVKLLLVLANIIILGFGSRIDL